ncbi:hypothetical protein [Actinocorallia lasiicapitis]
MVLPGGEQPGEGECRYQEDSAPGGVTVLAGRSWGLVLILQPDQELDGQIGHITSIGMEGHDPAGEHLDELRVPGFAVAGELRFAASR